MRLDSTRSVLSERLLADASAPVAVAFSGGGDSLALLLIAQAWAQAHGRRLLVLNVDHRLQPQGATWTQACEAVAERLGLPFRGLAWTAPKPERGVPAAARAARHRLLAQAARDAGARVILMGHTADDRLEAGAMRAAGSTTPDPRPWSPSPVWPEGRGMFLLRPLLTLRRAQIRDWLRGRGERWIEDPANDDPRYARARARAALRPAATPCTPPWPGEAAALAEACAADDWGGLSISREALRVAGDPAGARFLSAACLSASGTSRPPRGEPLRRLLAALRDDGDVARTLAGARIEARSGMVRLWREAGEAARGGLEAQELPAGGLVVWDGRYEVAARQPGLTIRRLGGVARRLAEAERRRLAAVPAAARGALPAIVDTNGGVSCPLLAPTAGVAVGALGRARLLAACGAIRREPI